jgi:hypothetical protein
MAVADHLADCSSCATEEAAYRSVFLAAREVPTLKVAEGFNARLLDRVAHERFAETRTKAYLPKSAPVFSWARVLPVAVSAMVIALVGIFAFMPGSEHSSGALANSDNRQADDLYLTVQPTNNPNMTVSMKKNWSIADQYERSQRVNDISNRIMNRVGFGSLNRQSRLASSPTGYMQARPYVKSYYRVWPILKFYRSSDSSRQRGGDRIY